MRAGVHVVVDPIAALGAGAGLVILNNLDECKNARVHCVALGHLAAVAPNVVHEKNMMKRFQMIVLVPFRIPRRSTRRTSRCCLRK